MMRERQAFRRHGLVAVAVVLAAPLWVQVDRSAVHAQASAQMPNFTGTVASLDAADVRGVRFQYDAGARSYWHVHEGALVLLVEQGRGRAQVKGQKIQEFGPGEPVLLPANVPHWHGAAPKEGLTWVALTVGRKVTWMDPVSDNEYLGR